MSVLIMTFKYGEQLKVNPNECLLSNEKHHFKTVNLLLLGIFIAYELNLTYLNKKWIMMCS